MSSDTRQAGPRYWCHICNAEVPIYMAPDPTCQQCNEQFIEELHSDDDPREFLAGAEQPQHHSPTNTTDNGEVRVPLGSAHFFSYSPSTGRMNNHGEMGDDIFQYFTPPPPSRNNDAEDGRERHPASDGSPSPLGNFVQNLLSNMLGQNVDINTTTQPSDGEGATHGADGRPMVFFGNMVDGNLRFQPMPAGQSMPGGMPNFTGSRNLDEQNEDGENANSGTRNNNNNEDLRGNNIASLLQFLSAMTGGAIDGGLVGNPNDYVFSQTALDNIITQLMEQTGGTSAPPPAPEQVIESLQKRELTEQEKDREADCAVCKDQFEPKEQVIQLPCEHIFHDECIKPWLKLNSTCPVCRHSVLPAQQEQDNNNNNNNRNNNDPDDNTPSNNDTQRETNRSTANDNNNSDTSGGNTSSNSNTSNNSNSGGGNGNSTRTPLSGYAWIGGGSIGGNNGQQSSSWPLNLSAAFPWAEGLVRQANSNANNINNNDTANTAPSSAANNNNSSSSNQIDEDLDLD
ncbi:hypothetical protein [Parasitella parasitica]|uniref:RING-type E3 ubiquitin transferase n=1 Tax=Parasitella parasitica TaxID=35722 RepID=A0A0B7N618_9FUNG|nr:hypothetical protein [Parasitella parasitica]